ncbi:MAG: T9SS type A sorting domain-containing protein [Cytophagales bacterium]|nr:T9SS type A sorting domain-containing protein [Cytophagales bacterium]
MKKNLLTIIVAILSVWNLNAANNNISNLITASDWNTIFPNRAQAGHSQGATDDHYSYAKFISAVDKISDYSVTFSAGTNGKGTSVSVTKTDGSSWTYVITSSSWEGTAYTQDYSTFCNTGNIYNDKRELAAFLANITKETTGGWTDPDPSLSASNQPIGSHGSWGLHWLRELGPGGNASLKSSNCYTSGSTLDYKPVSGKCYYGRGPIQLSYHYNYGNFSEFLYDNTTLVSNPDLLEQDGELAFLSALWFWMTPQCPKPSCHQVMQEIYDESATTYSSAKMNKKGFLHTVNIINGSVECFANAWDKAKPVLRSKLYRYYMSLIGFTSTEIANEDLGDYSTMCNESWSTMQAYTSCDFQNIVINTCSGPRLGDDKELSEGTALLDANVVLKSGESIAWYKNGNIINGETKTTYTATEAGTYKVVVTGVDCTKEDQIVIFEEGTGPVCSIPALGDDQELSGGSATLNANVTLQDGESIAWYKNGNVISGVTTTTYTATSIGTYKAVITGNRCTEEDEIVISAEVIVCSKPALGNDVELSGGSVTLNTNVTLKSGESIAWYKNGNIIWGVTTTTYTVSSAGTYKAIVTGKGCIEEDEIVVSTGTVICSKPSLGNDIELSSGSAVLNANVTLKNGESITWYKDGITLWGIYTTTYTATSAGTYKAVITGQGCTEEDEIIVSAGTIICSQPSLGNDIELSGGSAVLNANVTLKNGESIAWYKDGITLWGITTTTYTATSAGTYKAVITGQGCTKEDEIIVSAGTIICSSPNLGGNQGITDGSIVLDANITLKSGETITWYKNGNTIWGVNTTTYTATTAGIYKAVVTATGCTEEDEVIISEETNICSQPSLGNDVELSGGSIVLDANITLQNGESIAWYKDGNTLWGVTTTTYTATSAGTYKVVVTGTGCTKEDEIIISPEKIICSSPNLGNDVELSGGSVILDANITLQNGESIAWYKNGNTLWGVTTTTYTATSVGTYKVVVTSTGCTEEDEIVISPEKIICSSPNLDGNKGLLPGESIVLDANITLKSGETITWYKDGITLWGINTTTYTATAVGTYKVVVKNGTSCSEEDEAIISENKCSTPNLGNDVTVCTGTNITLDANVILEIGESVKWYKDNIEINGATSTNYTPNTSGTYKVEIIGQNNCLNADEITITDGGAQSIQITASNDGVLCSTPTQNNVTLTVTGGGGTYDFYDVSAGGQPIGSGTSFSVDNTLIGQGETKTFYAQESGNGTGSATVGATEAYTDAYWTDFKSNYGWNDYRMVFNTFDDVTLESIDFVLGYKAIGPYTIIVTIYEYGTNNVVETKQVELDGNNISTSTWAPYPLNTAELGIELPKGNYEMSFIGSTFSIQVNNRPAGVDVGYNNASYSSAGIAEIIGVNQPFRSNVYPQAIQYTHVGAYNWVFTKRGGTGTCGRASIDLTSYCGVNSINEVIAENISIYPNPASNVINIALGSINTKNVSIEMYNSFGQLVTSQNINITTENITQFETTNFENGLYFIKVLADGKVYKTSNIIIMK